MYPPLIPRAGPGRAGLAWEALHRGPSLSPSLSFPPSPSSAAFPRRPTDLLCAVRGRGRAGSPIPAEGLWDATGSPRHGSHSCRNVSGAELFMGFRQNCTGCATTSADLALESSTAATVVFLSDGPGRLSIGVLHPAQPNGAAQPVATELRLTSTSPAGSAARIASQVHASAPPGFVAGAAPLAAQGDLKTAADFEWRAVRSRVQTCACLHVLPTRFFEQDGVPPSPRFARWHLLPARRRRACCHMLMAAAFWHPFPPSPPCCFGAVVTAGAGPGRPHYECARHQRWASAFGDPWRIGHSEPKSSVVARALAAPPQLPLILICKYAANTRRWAGPLPEPEPARPKPRLSTRALRVQQRRIGILCAVHRFCGQTHCRRKSAGGGRGVSAPGSSGGEEEGSQAARGRVWRKWSRCLYVDVCVCVCVSGWSCGGWGVARGGARRPDTTTRAALTANTILPCCIATRIGASAASFHSRCHRAQRLNHRPWMRCTTSSAAPS